MFTQAGIEAAWRHYLSVDPQTWGISDMKAALEAAAKAAPPLPEEIAGLIKPWIPQGHPGCMMPDGADPCPQWTSALERVRQLEAALRALAQENERLKVNIGMLTADDKKRAEERADLLVKIRELEAERDAIRDELRKIANFIEPHWQGAGAKLEADWIIRAVGQMNSEADAIRAKTFEECAAINDAAAESMRRDEKRYSRAGYLALVDAATAVRALAQTDGK
jgi:hypothetical protein